MFAHVTMFNAEPCNFWCEVDRRDREDFEDLDWWIDEDSCVGSVPDSALGWYLFHDHKNVDDELSDVYTLYDDPDQVPDHIWAQIMRHALCPNS